MLLRNYIYRIVSVNHVNTNQESFFQLILRDILQDSYVHMLGRNVTQSGVHHMTHQIFLLTITWNFNGSQTPPHFQQIYVMKPF
jgi:hypothetical protein